MDDSPDPVRSRGWKRVTGVEIVLPPPDIAAWTCWSTPCGARKTLWANLYLCTTWVCCSATRSLVMRRAAGVVALQTGVGGRRGDVPGDLGSAQTAEHQPFPTPIVGTDGVQGRHGARRRRLYGGVDQGAGAGGVGLGTRTVIRPLAHGPSSGLGPEPLGFHDVNYKARARRTQTGFRSSGKPVSSWSPAA